MRHLIGAAFIISLTFCMPGAVSADHGTDSIKIGATLALTGTLAFVGESERDGLLLAVDEINQSGGVAGRRIELIVEDNLGEAKTAVNSVQKLLQTDKPLVVFSAFTHITQPIKDIVARSNALLFYASTVKSMAHSSPYVFRDYYDIQADGRDLAGAVSAAGYSGAVLLRDDGEACEELGKSFEEEALKRGIRLLRRYEFASPAPDLKALLLKATTSRPEALVLCAWRDSHLLIRHLSQLGRLDIPTFHMAAPFLPVADTPEIRKLYEENGAVSTWYGFADGTDSRRQRKFIKAFFDRFGHRPRPDAAYAYDDIFALKKVFELCIEKKTLNRDCVASELMDLSYRGVSGVLAFDSNGSSSRKSLLITVRGGVWKELK